MLRLVKVLSSSGYGDKEKKDDDWVDRISRRYTVVLLIAFAICLTLTSIVRNPITCWAPKHFTGSHTKYTNSFCWVKNTYYIPFEEVDVPLEGEDREHILYYQWIPLIMLAQAALFYFPSIVWHGLNQKGGIDADNILASAGNFSSTKKFSKRKQTLSLIINQIDRFLNSRKGYVAGFHVSKGVRNALCSNRSVK